MFHASSFRKLLKVHFLLFKLIFHMLVSFFFLKLEKILENIITCDYGLSIINFDVEFKIIVAQLLFKFINFSLSHAIGAWTVFWGQLFINKIPCYSCKSNSKGDGDLSLVLFHCLHLIFFIILILQPEFI